MPDETTSPSRGGFAQTQWTMVLAAAALDGSAADAALAQLCQTYWYPLYAFVRRQGQRHHDAEDLTQAFFGRLLEKNYIADADRDRGRFRSFLLAAVKHFMANEWDRRRAKKRGGGFKFVPFDAGAAERFEGELGSAGAATPEELYELRWAHTVLEHTLASLRESYAANGQEAMFDALKPCLTEGRGAVPYREVADLLRVAEGAVKVAAHRIRDRYRAHLRREIAQTVASEDEVEEEFHYLRAVLSRG